MGWNPLGHTSTCGCINVCFCLLDNSGFISYRINLARTAGLVCQWYTMWHITKSRAAMGLWLYIVLDLLFPLLFYMTDSGNNVCPHSPLPHIHDFSYINEGYTHAMYIYIYTY